MTNARVPESRMTVVGREEVKSKESTTSCREREKKEKKKKKDKGKAITHLCDVCVRVREVYCSIVWSDAC